MKNQSSSKSGKSKAQKPSKHEIIYATKQVDTSIALLDSPEDSVVLEALTYLSEYANIQENNLNYIRQHGILQKLLNLFGRNVCILRLTLRFLIILLTRKDVVLELDQEVYDEKVLKVSNMFISHKDTHVKQYCMTILSKLMDSYRITCLVFNMDLFRPIMDIFGKTLDVNLLEATLELLLKLVAPLAAIEVLPETYDLDISVLVRLLDGHEKKIVRLSYEVIKKITFYHLDVFQKMFRKAKLIETMLEVLMCEQEREYHETATDIIVNSMKSEETSDYFIESLEFLKFCQWVKICNEEYLFLGIFMLEKLTRIPSRRQILFDLSMEESILSFFRSSDERVLNMTCEAISNMTTHRYCCEEMLKPAVLKELFRILVRKDQENTGNEVALKTILDFNRRNLNTLDMIHNLGAHKVLLGYFKKGIGYISEESFSAILEILQRMSITPQFQQDIASSSFFEKLLCLFQTASTSTATPACEIMTNFINCLDFQRVFLTLEGPRIFIEKLPNPKDMGLLKIVLLFMHNSLVYDNMVNAFLQNNIVGALKAFPAHLKQKMPIAEKILRLIYNLRLPLKLFDTHRLDFTDKIRNKFYVINGQWNGPFPPFKRFEEAAVSTPYAVYVVDYSSEIKYEDDNSASSETISPGRISSERTLSTLSRVSSSLSSYFRRGTFHVSYGRLSADPFLPTYIYHVTKYLTHANTMESKVMILAKYIDAMLCEPVEGYTKIEKVHHLKLHVEILKHKLGSNLIPVGFLRLGSYCEKALLFKAIADKCCIPASLVRGKTNLYWNEVILFDHRRNNETFKLYVVDLMHNIGELLLVGSRSANQYCDIRAWNG